VVRANVIIPVPSEHSMTGHHDATCAPEITGTTLVKYVIPGNTGPVKCAVLERVIRFRIPCSRALQQHTT
jgi:hypothetical protein